jgi:hypothetical protein
LELAKQTAGPWRMARISAELGDKDQAFAWLEKGIDERGGLIPFLRVTPIFDSLHSDPLFTILLRRIGLTE